MRRLGMLALLLVALIGGAATAPAGVRGIEVVSESTKNLFPDGAQFTVFVSADAEVRSARLRYKVLPFGSIGFSNATCTPGTVSN